MSSTIASEFCAGSSLRAMTPRGVTGRTLMLAVAVLGICAAAPGAGAEGTQNWMRFSNSSGGYDAVDSRTFAQQWEANPPRGYTTLSTENLGPMKEAIQRYGQIVKDGGWPTIPSAKMGPGHASSAVALLRKRLALSGDLAKGTSTSSTSYDYYVEKAVRRFQASNGLTPTGRVDKRTLMALNVPAKARLRQLQINLTRVASYARSAAKRYIMVNIPAAQIEAVENGRVVSRHAGVVGKLERKTPLLKSSVHELNFNPVWRLPPTVVSQDLIPKGRKMERSGKNVLVKYGIDAYSASGKKLDPENIKWNSSQPLSLSYRQKPGKENPMGFVKINFHNAYSVYMHDTPSRSIFGRNFRAASSGCVRVQDIAGLSAWILKDSGDWNRQRVLGLRNSGERLDVKVKKPVPVYFVYVTAWATKDGVVQFRRDLYRKDGVGVMASAY